MKTTFHLKWLRPLLFLAPMPLFAATPVVTTLQNGVTINSTVTGGDTALASTGNWFIFAATAGASIDIDINRLAAAPDLIATLFYGNVTGVDVDSLISPSTTTIWNLYGGALPAGPLAHLNSQDDTEDDAFGGPWGDPRITATLAQSGTYSVLVSALVASSNGNPVGQPFNITVTGADVSAIPEPGNALALGALIVAGAFLRTRRS